MNPQRDAMITRQKQKQLIEGEISPWILESPMTISKTESLSASIATSMDIWKKNADQRRKNIILGNVSNATKKGI